MSYEDYFCEQMVNLQNPYFYIPHKLKSATSNNFETIQKYSNDKEDFFNKLSSKFTETSQTKSISQNNSAMKIKLRK